MIRSFRCKDTEKLFNNEESKKFHHIEKQARKQLLKLDAATNINDLRNPPGNRLEALKGDRKGQHSIRINDGWRICFIWTDNQADDVEIVEYH